jgi:hypothetical protein
MNAKEILQKLKLALMDEPTPSGEVKTEMIIAKLKDGTEVTVDKLEVGGIVMIGIEPAPVGEHILADGTKIVLLDNGVIESITPAEEPIEGPLDAMYPKKEMDARFAKIEQATTENFIAYEAKFSSYEGKFAEYEAKLNKANTVIEGLLGLTQLLVEQPTATADAAASNGAAKFTKVEPKEILENVSKVFFTKKAK